MELQKLVNTVYDAMTEVRKYSLKSEVMATAMIEMSKDPSLTPEDALQRGMDEWLK